MKKKIKIKRKLHVKIGEKVKIISGNQKGEVSFVKKIIKQKNKLIIEGINMKIRHIKATRPSEDGEIKRMEFPIDISNVSSYNE